jgi:hypothetical protein
MRIDLVTASSAPRAHCVLASVDGSPLWFESPDLDLQAAPEAFGSALMIAALAKGERLVFADACDPQWLRNADRLQPIVDGWWGYGTRRPASRSRQDAPRSTTSGTALCFSGGVDSFYSLLRFNQPIDQLLTVHGYDVKLHDHARFAMVEETTRRVASAIGARSVVIRTNLREHPAFKAAPWVQTHGGALASLGHLLTNHISRLVISSSIAFDHDEPWGSHWRIDPLWSSGRLEIVHFGAAHRRGDKLREIAHEPLVREHLRVCWENRALSGNCSHCEKCVRTRLLLASCGELDNFRGFEGTARLAADLDALAASGVRGRVYLRPLEQGGLGPELEAAVRRFVVRLEKAHRPPVRRPAITRALSWARSRLT